MKVPKEPIIFLKPSSSLAAHKDSIVYPESVGRLDYEAELALVIKRKAKNIPKNKAKDYILGYTCLNDITARDLQAKDGQWTRAKSFDGFCPLGPWLETGIEPSSLRIASYLNGVLKQYSNTANFIFPVDYLVSFISRVMTLSPGDVISTGTPYGVGSMQRGDTIEVDIENIGRLKNHVR
jgi:2-keto-4-pentenoate hydratase/2-oxohepta-3-ene-1,7-dioic acid hydratase in catechol pathway